MQKWVALTGDQAEPGTQTEQKLQNELTDAYAFLRYIS